MPATESESVMSSEELGPAVQRELLIQELKRLRLGRKETQEQVANARDWSVSKFTRIENGNSPISKSDLEGLLRYYGVEDQDRIDELVSWAKGAREPGWWLKFYHGDDRAFEAYLGYEDGASSIRMSHGLAVPGLLQTEAYMRALLATYNLPPEEVEEAVKLRLERQKRIAASGPEQCYILDETIIRRPIADVMHDQLRHLLRAPSPGRPPSRTGSVGGTGNRRAAPPDRVAHPGCSGASASTARSSSA